MICIPAYNEEGRIGKVIRAARLFATKVVVFDDGSTDGTAEESKINGATVIKNEKNEGYGNAINMLLRLAKEENVDIMVTIDSDGQHDPTQIPYLIKPLVKKECDIVIGSRLIREDDADKIPKYRKLGIRTITKATQIASYDSITDAQSGFRAYSKNALSKLRLYEKGMSVSTEIIIDAKDQRLKIIEVPITVSYDLNSSTHNPLLHGLGVLSSVIRFITYSKPLIFYILPGVILFVVTAIFANDARNIYLHTGYISTNTILVSIGTGMIGFICISTGAIVHTLQALSKRNKKSSGGVIYRHPFLFYIIPGAVLFGVGAIFGIHARELYIQSLLHQTAERYPTNLILASIVSGLVGAVFISTGAVIYTVLNLFRSRISEM
jgi:glycosyltransferase involved in cell wall biosynthesis